MLPTTSARQIQKPSCACFACFAHPHSSPACRTWQSWLTGLVRPRPKHSQTGISMRAFLFPGQGSQSVGMGAALAEASAAARDVFRRGRRGARPEPVQADARGAGGRAQADRKCPAGDHGARARGVPRAEQRRRGRSLDKAAQFVAGHSLGEYSALCAAGAFDLPTTARLLKLRGQAMQAAVPVGVGAMAALLGADLRAGRRRSPRPRPKARSAPSPTTTTRARS